MKFKTLLTAIAVTAAFALSAVAGPQASITLLNGDVALCHKNNTAWTLDKIGSYANDNPSVPGVGKVTWQVLVKKGVTGPNMLYADGFITIKNTGSAGATIGNIVVNLQERKLVNNKWYWISAAADCANAANGDFATSANIVKGTSTSTQEDPQLNGSYGPGNYTVSGQQGTFTETSGSSTLSFRDPTDNTIWALSPQKIIGVGESVDLKWVAEFNNSILQIPAGTPVRVEIIVTFGNAGERGGSGATAQNIDISGDGNLQPDEAWARSVPSRKSLTVPPLEECNKYVLLTDTEDDDLALTGTVTKTSYSSDITPEGDLLSDSATKTIIVGVKGGTAGGEACNTAHLEGESGSVVAGGYEFACCEGINLSKESCVDVPKESPAPPPPPPPPLPNLCTYSKGGWGGGGTAAQLLVNNFNAVFGNQLVIGGYGGHSITFKQGSYTFEYKLKGTKYTRTVTLEPWQFIQGVVLYGVDGDESTKYNYSGYLPDGGAGKGNSPGVLDQDLTNTDSSSAGVFGAQVLGLKINVAMSAAGVTPAGFGALKFKNSGVLNGVTVAQFLADCEKVLGGGTSAYGLTMLQMHSILGGNGEGEGLNAAFRNCVIQSWANSYLTQ